MVVGVSAVRHYMGPTPCPKCGDERYDPETDACRACEPVLRIYRVSAYSQDWLIDTDEAPPPAPVKLSSRRNVGITALSLLGDDTDLIIIQRVKE